MSFSVTKTPLKRVTPAPGGGGGNSGGGGKTAIPVVVSTNLNPTAVKAADKTSADPGHL